MSLTENGRKAEVRDKMRTLPEDEDTISLGSRRTEKVLKGLLTFILGIAIVFAVWQGVAWWFNTFQAYAISFPEPVETMRSFWEYLSGERMLRYTIYDHLFASIERWMVGYAVAILIGLAIGMVLGTCPRFYDIGMVPVNVLQMVPGLAWIPVAFLLFGLGNGSAIFIIAASAISPIAINVAAGIRNVPQVNIRTAEMIGISKAKMFTKVLLPYAAVDMVNGLRIGMANAWRMLIAAEMVVGVAIGLGYAIDQSVYMADYVTSFVCIIMICIFGLLIDKAIFSQAEKYARERLGAEAA